MSGTQHSKLNTQDLFLSLGLFLLALLPRAYDLPRFVTADEAKWVYRSAQFLAALLQGDYSGTNVNLTPAVTTTWLGGLGLALYYQLHQAALNLSFTDWLLSLPEFRTDLDVLVAARWPMVVLTSLGVVIVFWLGLRLFNRPVAFIAAAFIALDPHLVSLSRILGHDAPTAVFMTISVLLLLLAINRAGEQKSRGARGEDENLTSAPLPLRSSASWIYFSLSGIAAGLAFLSKAPALFLIPFAGLLFLVKLWGDSRSLYFWVKRFLLWGVAAYLTFIVFWPAAWVEPLAQPQAVVENAFLSATDQEEADEEGYWLVPDLGPFYYLVNGAFKLSPLVMTGVLLALIQLSKKQSNHPPNQLSNQPTTLLWLLAFVLLFTLFMTLSDKRSPRYILPAFPVLAILAAGGWLWLYQVAGERWQVAGDKSQGASDKLQGTSGRSQVASETLHAPRSPLHAPRSTLPALRSPLHALRSTLSAPRSSLPTPLVVFSTILVLAAVIILLPYAPYYFSYYNPLVGGSFTAPRLVKIGWGEGLDQVGRFLQREAETRRSRVGTAYASTVAPFFEGDLSGVTAPKLDYVVLYSKQVQSGEPSPTAIRYYEQLGSLFSVKLNGLHYADVYPGPAVQPALTLTPGLDHAILPKPISFRPLTPYGHLGETLTVDVLWLAEEPLPFDPSVVTLEPMSVFDFLDEHNHPNGQPVEPRQRAILAEGSGYLTRQAGNLVVSRHDLPLPANLARGSYALLVDGRPLGEVELRNFQMPPELNRVAGVDFAGQIGLAGYQFAPTEDYLGLTVAWQAQQDRLPDYTVFVQLLDMDTGERVAGIDTQPLKGEWPTSRWIEGEVVVDEYFVAVPPDLPPGFYSLIVGLYRPDTGQRLTLSNGQDHWLVPWTYVKQ